MDRRRSRYTHEALAELLRIDGTITHIATDHRTGIVEIFWIGNGSFAVAEGQESAVRSPDDWRKAELEKELNNGNRTGRRNIVPDQG